MNPTQLWALLRLRYQLTWNQVKKAGKISTVLSVIFYAIATMVVCSSFFVTAIAGAFLFEYTDPFSMVMMWNIIGCVFLFVWLAGLVTELQQTEMISIDKMLHLPVSLKGAFFLNYTTTFANGAFLFFAPAMLGLCVGMIFGLGWRMAIAIPLVITFLFMVTSLTHQLRGWLAGVMENPRTKGTIGAVFVILIIAGTQIPNLAYRYIDGKKEDQVELAEEAADLQRASAVAFLEIPQPGAISTGNDLDQQTNGWEVIEINAEIDKRLKKKKLREKRLFRSFIADTIKQVDAYVPPGWMPLGIYKAYEGNLIPGLLGSLGMFLIGSVSLALSYRSSMNRYTGNTKRRKKKAVAKAPPNLAPLFRKLPLCSDSISGVAMATHRGLMRAPETKLMLIMPLLMVMFGGAYFFSGSDFKIPDTFWPAFPIAGIALTMFSIVSSIFNQFGMDRDGFRAYVISPIERRDILIGKNLALIPLSFGISLLLLVVLQIVFPNSLLVFVASLLQIPCNFLLYCLAGNTASIFFPMGIKRGNMQPVNPSFLPMLIMVLATFALPNILLMPTAMAIGVPMLLEMNFGWSLGLTYLALTIIQLIATVWLYFYVVRFQGFWLWSREPKILEVVANIPE